MNKIIVIKRNGNQVGFDEAKIWAALSKAFLADGKGRWRGSRKRGLSSRQRVRIAQIVTQLVLDYLALGVAMVHAQQVHDRVLAMLFAHRHFSVARAFSVWREGRARMLARAGDSFAWTLRAAPAYPAVADVAPCLANPASPAHVAACGAGARQAKAP